MRLLASSHSRLSESPETLNPISRGSERSELSAMALRCFSFKQKASSDTFFQSAGLKLKLPLFTCEAEPAGCGGCSPGALVVGIGLVLRYMGVSEN